MKKLFVIALAAVGMVACVNDEIVETPQGNAISFDNAFIDNATRAELTAVNLDKFKVWGYIDADGTQVSLFEGDEVSKATGDWTYGGGARYWAPGMHHYFQAIAPLTAVEAVHDDGEVSAIDYTVDGDSDLIYAAYDKVGAAAGSTNGPVSFTFGHLLSKVEFEFVNGFAAEDGVSIAVKNVKMTVPAKGTYDIETGKWTVNPTVAGNKTLENIVGAKFVLPYDNSYAYAIEFDVDVTYGTVVINKDVHKTSSVMVALEKGTAYKFTATINAETLNMESIDFEVGEVGDWTPGDDSTLGTAYVSTVDALQAALNNPDVDTIVLSEDVNLTEALTVDATSRTRAAVEPVAVTLDLNGHDIVIDAAYDAANYEASSAIVNNATLTLTGNGTIKATNNYTVRNNGTMIIDGVTIENGIMNFNDLTIESGNISNSRTGKHSIYGNNAKLTINGGTFYNGNPGNATIYSQAGEVVINNGEFSIADGTATLGWTSCLLDAQGGAKYDLYDGIFNGEIRDYNKNTKVYGGTYTHNSVTNFVADGYAAILRDGKYVVLPACDDAAALQEAINAGGTVVLSGDVEVAEPIVISDGVNVVLDLNGKKLYANTASGYAIQNTNGSTLRITDTGNGAVSGIVYNENSNMIVDGGTFNATEGGMYVFLNTGGTLTINGGTINGGSSYPVYSYNENSKLVINDVTVNGTFGCINAYTLGGEVEINGGTFSASFLQGTTSHIAYFSNVDVTINGGTFKKVGDVSMSAAGGGGVCAIYGAELTINGGEFAGDYADVYNWGGTNANGRETSISISGGSYKFKPSANFVADGLHAVQKDGKYIILPEGVDAVAGTTAELNSAIANGENVMLEADVTTGTDFNAETTSIDLNGNTLTMTSSDQKVKGDLTVKNGDVNVSKGYFDVRPTDATSTHLFEGVVFGNTEKKKTTGNSTNHIVSAIEFCPQVSGDSAEFVFRKCTFNNAKVIFEGVSGVPANATVVFEECTFNNFGNTEPIEVVNYLTIDITVKDCDFNIIATSNVRVVDAMTSSTVTVNFEGNNTVYGEAAVPTDSSLAGTVDEIRVFSSTSVKVKGSSVDTVNGLQNVTCTGIATKE